MVADGGYSTHSLKSQTPCRVLSPPKNLLTGGQAASPLHGDAWNASLTPYPRFSSWWVCSAEDDDKRFAVYGFWDWGWEYYIFVGLRCTVESVGSSWTESTVLRWVELRSRGSRDRLGFTAKFRFSDSSSSRYQSSRYQSSMSKFSQVGYFMIWWFGNLKMWWWISVISDLDNRTLVILNKKWFGKMDFWWCDFSDPWSIIDDENPHLRNRNLKNINKKRFREIDIFWQYYIFVALRCTVGSVGSSLRPSTAACAENKYY